jgi:hypothetical protein
MGFEIRESDKCRECKEGDGIVAFQIREQGRMPVVPVDPRTGLTDYSRICRVCGMREREF